MTKPSDLISPNRLLPILATLALFALVILAYFPAVGAGYIWDDDIYVYENELLDDASGLSRIWLDPVSQAQYYPMVFSSFWIEEKVWGDNPAGYHLTNIILHALNTCLLWMLLKYLNVPGAWFAAALFGVHPIHTESVAWISERKNTLYVLFYLLSLKAFLSFHAAKNDQSGKRQTWPIYLASLLLYLAAIFSKTVACSLPLIILLILWWRNRVRKKDLFYLGPFFAVGFLMGLFTLWLETEGLGAVGKEWSFSLIQRLLIASRAFWFYLGKILWPASLSFIYPRWQVDAGIWWQYLYLLAAVACLSTLWLFRNRMGKAPLTAILFFSLTLFPALGFVNTFPMRFSFVADHFQYLASVGPIALLIGTLFYALRRPWHKRALICVLGCLLTLFVGLSRAQSRVYHNEKTLYEDVLSKNPSSWMAHNNLGVFLYKQGDLKGAKEHYTKVLALKPDYAQAYYNLALAFNDQGFADKAIKHYQKAIEEDPLLPQPHYNLGLLLLKKEEWDEALKHFRRSLAIRPKHTPPKDNINARYYLAFTLVKKEEYDQAIEEFDKVLKLDPKHKRAHNNMAFALLQTGEVDQAKKHYQQALGIDPQDFVALYGLGAIALTTDDYNIAKEYLEKALKQKPGQPEVTKALQILKDRL